MSLFIECACGNSYEINGEQSQAECPECGAVMTASEMLRHGIVKTILGEPE